MHPTTDEYRQRPSEALSIPRPAAPAPSDRVERRRGLAQGNTSVVVLADIADGLRRKCGHKTDTDCNALRRRRKPPATARETWAFWLPTAGARASDGEMSLLAGASRSATVVAAEPVTAYRVAKAQLEPILNRSPSLYDRFAAMAEKRNAELERIYGTGIGKLYFVSRAQFVEVMRAFFGKAG